MSEHLHEEEYQVKIPKSILRYCQDKYCNIQVNFNPTDGINGYGLWIHKSLIIYEYYQRCINCGYHSLLRPELIDKCKRHTYEKGYAPTFAITNFRNEEEVDAKFHEWLKVKNGEKKMSNNEVIEVLTSRKWSENADTQNAIQLAIDAIKEPKEVCRHCKWWNHDRLGCDRIDSIGGKNGMTCQPCDYCSHWEEK